MEQRDMEKPDENAKIWRYMDFTKFVNLLERKTLFFSRADKLGDPFEGSFSRFNVKMRPAKYKQQPEILSRLSKLFERFREYTLVNCWCISEYELNAMWRIYLQSNEGIAIQSRFSLLKESLADAREDSIFIGKVHYIDYNRDLMQEDNSLDAFFYKRQSFAFENELRAVTQALDAEALNKPPPFEFGKYISVNLDTLIEKVYVSPTASSWFSELVKAVAERYQLGKDIVLSTLSERPVY